MYKASGEMDATANDVTEHWSHRESDAKRGSRLCRKRELQEQGQTRKSGQLYSLTKRGLEFATTTRKSSRHFRGPWLGICVCRVLVIVIRTIAILL